jgi:cobalt/nickel transport system permease protein
MAFGGWCSIVLAAIACAGELAWSGTVSWRAALPAMAGIHALIGLGEGMVSGLVLLAIARVRPDLVPDVAATGGTRSPGLREFVAPGLLVAAGTALFVAPFASPWPDGLDSVARRLGFAQRASEPVIASPIPDYQVPGLAAPGAATALAGVTGVLVVFALAILFSRIIVRESGGSRSDA